MSNWFSNDSNNGICNSCNSRMSIVITNGLPTYSCGGCGNSCGCNTTPSTTNCAPCSPECSDMYNTSCIVYNGENIDCVGIIQGDGLNEVITKITDLLCSEAGFALPHGRIPFGDVNDIATNSDNLYFDETNERLSIGGLTAPNYGLTLSSGDPFDAGISIQDTVMVNTLTGWVPPSPMTLNLLPTTVGVIMPGSSSGLGILQIFGFNKVGTNAAGLQLKGITSNTTAGGALTFQTGKQSATNTVIDVPATENAITFKPLVSNTIVMAINGRGGIKAGGTGVATANLHAAAGTSAANTAPLKLTTGANLTVPEVGAVEYDNTFHVTNSDGIRRHVATAPNTTKVTAGAPYTNDGYIIIRIAGVDFKVMTTA